MFEDIVQKIITKRKEEYEKVKVQLERLQSIQAGLVNLKKISDNIAVYEPVLETNAWLETALKEIDLDKSIQLCDNSIQLCRDLAERFSRETINISIIGNERHGKSTFLQRVSGLDNRCIPALSGRRCTGVASIIKNCDMDGVSAEIHFKSTDEMREEINDYLTLISGKGIDDLKQLETITKQQLESAVAKLKSNIKENMEGQTDSAMEASVFASTFYEDYVASYRDWKNLVQDEPSFIVCTDENEIVKYVARYDEQDCHYNKFIAVKQITISKRFRQNGIGGIQLIDTVGLNDLSLGTLQRMLEAIRKRSDAVIYCVMPEDAPGIASLQGTQSELIKLLDKNFGEKQMNKWMACLINQRTGKPDQEKNCRALKVDMEKIYKGNPPFSRIDIVDASNEEEADSFVLRFLNDVAASLSKIDSVYVEDVNRAIEDANHCALEICEYFDVDLDSNSYSSLDHNFLKAYENMRQSLCAFRVEASRTYDDIKAQQLKSVIEYGRSDKIEELLRKNSVGDREPMTHVLYQLWRKSREIAACSDEIVEQKERELKYKLAEIINQTFPLGVSTQDEHYFAKMAELLFKKDPLLKNLRDTFLCMDTFSLNSITGVIKLLFSYRAFQRFNGGFIGRLSSKTQNERGKNEAIAPGSVDIDDMKKGVSRRVEEFVNDIKSDALFQTPCTISIQQQINAEYGFFLAAFDEIYKFEWRRTFEGLYREGKIWSEEAADEKKKEEMIEEIRLIRDSILSAKMENGFIFL